MISFKCRLHLSRIPSSLASIRRRFCTFFRNLDIGNFLSGSFINALFIARITSGGSGSFLVSTWLFTILEAISSSSPERGSLPLRKSEWSSNIDFASSCVNGLHFPSGSEPIFKVPTEVRTSSTTCQPSISLHILLICLFLPSNRTRRIVLTRFSQSSSVCSSSNHSASNKRLHGFNSPNSRLRFLTNTLRSSVGDGRLVRPISISRAVGFMTG
mmetsp:Transcript_62/g.143  ORF Transcript_62/g.143 Transcript_62/m.143 type:complete len:214 (+) Transcript_62:124-765(+)